MIIARQINCVNPEIVAKIKNIKKIFAIENVLLFVSFLIVFIIIAKIIHLNANYIHSLVLRKIYLELNSNLDHQLLKYLFISLSATLTLCILSIRNKQLAKQSETQYEIFRGNSEFNNFLEATTILTGRDSTTEAKIASLYLLYDISKQHNDNVSRVIQIINKQIIPLINCLENNCNKQKNTQKLIPTKENSFLYKIENKYTYIYNDTICIDDINDINLKQIIKEWQYNGNDTERLVSVSLAILKKIFLKVQPDNQVNLSNTILFELDTDYERNDIQISKNKKPIENIIFLNCKLHKVNFSKAIYHQASFINCDLKSCNFNKAILWGALFDNCNLENVNFNKTECEAIEFKRCENLTLEQVEQMKFKYKDSEEYKKRENKKEYLIVLEDKLKGLTEDKYFKTVKEFIRWRYDSD